MSNIFIARSLVFYPDYYQDNNTELSDEIIIPSDYLNILINNFNDGETLYIDMINTDNNLSTLVTIGKSHSYNKNTIYAPQWILDLIGCTGNCNSKIIIKKTDISDIPVATKITITPLDPIAFEIDTLDCFEKAFMNLHSIREGISILVPFLHLNTQYEMYAHIDKVEPAPLSRIINGEINVEFINEFNKSAENHSISEFLQNIEDISDKQNIDNISNEIPVQEITLEERRKQIRESWAKKY